MPQQGRRGFTLIEVMVVVVIAGILAAIAIPRLTGTRREAYIASLRSDLRNLVPAQELFHADSLYYASDTAGLSTRPSPGTRLSLVAGPGYWAATASHEQVPSGFACAIAVNTQNPMTADAADGQPACGQHKGTPGTQNPDQ